MIKKYVNLYYFIKELPYLKDSIVVFPWNIEEQFNKLSVFQYKAVKKDIEKLNIRVIIEKEPEYELYRKR